MMLAVIDKHLIFDYKTRLALNEALNRICNDKS